MVCVAAIPLHCARVSIAIDLANPQLFVAGANAPSSSQAEGYTVTEEGFGNGPQVISTSDTLEVLCGPLLNYKRMSSDVQNKTFWHGSVLVVTKPGQRQPRLQIRPAGPVNIGGTQQVVNGDVSRAEPTSFDAVRLYADPSKEFWRFSISVPVLEYEARWQYTISPYHNVSGAPVKESWNFVVAAAEDSMRLMFHSCNGFSVGTDLDAWTGPVLWNDVLRRHEQKPFHVMIGGGDQIYNDGVRVDGPLKEWTSIANPQKRKTYPFSNEMRAGCDDYYFNNYVRWYTTEPFATANGQIPQINIWDDHDIIDGFGSYTDHFMRCAVFRGIGGVSFKYYFLFQHHLAPPKSTFTTDAPQTMKAVNGTAGVDPRQLAETFVRDEKEEDPSFIVGGRPGPYVEECSRNLYTRLGKRMAFVGIDARTERTRHQVNYPDTYDAIFSRLDRELSAANGEIKHLILLLGVPIAYPRLAWLENLISSPIIAPIRLLNKRFGVAGDLFNKFDGQVDLLDDLDDHYTARQHKRERREMMQRFQEIALKHSARVTILGGDVHLAAIGRFYSNPKLEIPSENDHRYMANVVSSAITNKPPPKPVANLLARRNKIHHMDSDTDETLMNMFNKQPGNIEKGAAWNKVTMPSRNYACISEIGSSVRNGAGPPHSSSGQPDPPLVNTTASPSTKRKSGHEPLHHGEDLAGTEHNAVEGVAILSGLEGGLDVCIRVEIEQGGPEGKTEGYGFSSKLYTRYSNKFFLPFLQSNKTKANDLLSYLVPPLHSRPGSSERHHRWRRHRNEEPTE